MARQWTVMVYMGADNIPGREKDLTADAHADLREMLTVGSDASLGIVVQIDDTFIRTPRRYIVDPGSLDEHEMPAGQTDMGDSRVLLDFLTFAMQHSPAERYMLILWGHAYRFGFDYDGSSGGDALDFKGLSDKLATFKQLRGGRNLEILGFDACGISAIENAYQVSPSVDYLVASEIGVPLMGWPYDRILKAIKAAPAISSESLSKAIVREYLASYKTNKKDVMMAALRLGDGQRLLTLMDRLSTSLGLVLTDPYELRVMAECFDDAQVSTREPLVDLRRLCENLRLVSRSAKVQDAATAMVDLLVPEDGFVIAIDAKGPDQNRWGGVSALGPHVVSPEVRHIIEERYNNLALAKDTFWPVIVGCLELAT